jgi:hypothetical protein
MGPGWRSLAALGSPDRAPRRSRRTSGPAEPPGAVALAPRLQGRIRRVPCLGVPVPALRSVDSVRLGTDDLHQWCPDHNAVIVALRTGTGMGRRRRWLSRQRWHVLRRSRRTVSNHRQDGDDTARSSRGARPSRICFLWGRYSPRWRRLNITNPGDHPTGGAVTPDISHPPQPVTPVLPSVRVALVVKRTRSHR